MFIFKIHKNDAITSEDFTSAVCCAKDSIESILCDFNVEITVEGDFIKIKTDDITAKDCKEKIKGCFRDSDGSMYSEFLRIELLPNGQTTRKS